MTIAVLSHSVFRRLTAQVDKLGELNAQIAELQDLADTIKNELKASGFDVIEGTLFKCAISTVVRSTLNSGRVKAMLSPAQIAACTDITQSVRLVVFDR